MNLRFWSWSLVSQMLAAVLVAIIAGFALRASLAPSSLDVLIAQVLTPLGTLFLRLIQMTVVPLVFCAIVLGVVELGEGHRLGRIGLKTLACALGFAAFSVLLALGLVNLIKPGGHLAPEKRAALVADYGHAAKAPAATPEAKPLLAAIIGFIPDNPIAEAATALRPTRVGGGIIGVMVFALAVGLAARSLAESETRAFRALCESGFALMMRIIGFAMRLAPLCVACLVTVTTARLGFELFGTLGRYVAVVIGGLLLEGVTLFPAVLWLGAGRSPLAFFRGAREAILTAFSTASSSATMPVAMRVAEEELRVPRPIARFAVILGAACNHNGTALFEAVTVLFLAQVFGIDLPVAAQLQVALLCMLSSVGAGGVPGGGLAMTIGVMATIGLPAEAIAIVMGVDRFLDMARTALNVTGDLVIATVVAGKPAG